MAVISGSATLIAADLEEQNLNAQNALRIIQASGRAASLVMRLRDLGKNVSERARIDLRKVLAEAEELLRAGMSTPHRLVVQSPDTPLFAVADSTDILQVLLNLGINARDSLDDGPNLVTLYLDSADLAKMDRPPDIGSHDNGIDYAMLRVEDTGPGVGQETRDRIFEPYFTSKGQQGTGLGLAIVSAIVRSNDVALWFDSAPGKGTRVTVFWPINQKKPLQIDSIEPLGTPICLEGVRVLIVDDEEGICTVLTAILEAAGAEVASTTDPRDALEAITYDPDHWTVLVTDHDMPHMTGTMLARATQQTAPDLPVILVSAVPDSAVIDSRLFKTILQKPVDPKFLIEAIRKTVGQKDNC